MKAASILFSIFLVLAGCSTARTVLPMGNDTYVVSSTGTTGFTHPSILKDEVIKEVEAFSASKGMDYEIVDIKEQTASVGVFPRMEIRFRLVPKE